jgi:hypothetical protein
VGIWLKNKGQVFLIAGVLFIVILVILRSTINIEEIEERQRRVEGNFQNKFFKNIVTELQRSAEISYNQPNNITDNVFGFGNFTRKKMADRLFGLEFFYVNTVSPTSGTQLNVSVINLLNKTINISLTLNSTTPQTKSKDDLPDYGKYDATFTITQGENYKLTIDYLDRSENVTVETENGKSVYTAFFDISLAGTEIIYKDKFQKSYTLPV